ncbi:hypothetical protein CCP4SC76_3550005 [Gammaproteobacteria bacterium]
MAERDQICNVVSAHKYLYVRCFVASKNIGNGFATSDFKGLRFKRDPPNPLDEQRESWVSQINGRRLPRLCMAGHFKGQGLGSSPRQDWR